MLGIFLDAATIVFFIYMFKKCAVKSQLKNAVESIMFVASAIVSVPIGVFLGNFCYSSFFRPVIVERVETLVTTSADVDTSMNPIERIMSGMPTMVNNGARIYHTTTGDSLNQINKLLAGDLSTATGEIDATAHDHSTRSSTVAAVSSCHLNANPARVAWCPVTLPVCA